MLFRQLSHDLKVGHKSKLPKVDSFGILLKYEYKQLNKTKKKNKFKSQ